MTLKLDGGTDAPRGVACPGGVAMLKNGVGPQGPPLGVVEPRGVPVPDRCPGLTGLPPGRTGGRCVGNGDRDRPSSGGPGAAVAVQAPRACAAFVGRGPLAPGTAEAPRMGSPSVMMSARSSSSAPESMMAWSSCCARSAACERAACCGGFGPGRAGVPADESDVSVRGWLASRPRCCRWRSAWRART